MNRKKIPGTERMTAITDQNTGGRMNKRDQTEVVIDIELLYLRTWVREQPHCVIPVVDQVQHSLRGESCSVPPSHFKCRSYLTFISSPSPGVI
jgi:hypothetical protein